MAMTRIEEAFNHAARMSDPAYLRKLERRKEREAKRIFGKGRLFIKMGDTWEELEGYGMDIDITIREDDIYEAFKYAFPKSITMTFTGTYTTPPWYHRVWRTIRRFLVYISNLD